LLDQAAQSVNALAHDRGGAACGQELSGGDKTRDRCAKLVRCAGCEPSLSHDALVERVGHLVDGAPERAHLV
jgi:hypothetical protein